MLQVRNCKLILLAALLIGAAGSLAAQSYGSGFFSVSATKRVRFATENYTSGETKYFDWDHLPTGQEVLTEDEWNYLLGTDAGEDGERTNAYQLYALGRIKTSTDPETYQNGLIILPDYETWVQPDGVNALDVDHTQQGYEKNTYSAADWNDMAAAGAVFLPCMGYSTNGTTGTDETTHGSYWIKTEDGYNTNNAYRLQFEDNLVSEQGTMAKTNKYSVRTVTTAPAILSENDEQLEFATKKALLASGTEAYIIRTLRKAGCFNTLTLPFNVPDIASSPLGGDNVEVYTFTSATVQDGTLLLDIARVTSNSLDAGTPYLIQWDNTGEVMTFLHFTGITSWDNDEEAENAGTGDVQFKGFYGKKHIDDDANHSNLFLAGGNELYWPNDGDDENAKMLGFRAFFNVTTGVSSSPIRRGMPAALRIVENSNTTTDVDHVQRDDAQCTKVMRDGQLYLLHNGRMYNVQGQMIKEGGLQ